MLTGPEECVEELNLPAEIAGNLRQIPGLKYGNAPAERGQNKSYEKAKEFLAGFRERARSSAHHVRRGLFL